MSYASDLDAALRYEKSPLASVPGSEVLTPEDLSALKGKQTKADYADQVRDAVRGREGLLPTLDEVKSLAQAGESTRGEYEHATRTITSFLQPHHAAGFVVLNAVLSPQTKWEEHSAGAMRLLRMWHERGEPTDHPKLTTLLDDFHNVRNPESGARAYTRLPDAGERIPLLLHPPTRLPPLPAVRERRRGQRPPRHATDEAGNSLGGGTDRLRRLRLRDRVGLR